MLIPRQRRDLAQWQVGFGEQLLHALELHQANLGLRGMAEILPELPFKQAPRHRRVLEHVLHRASVERALADEAEGGCDGRIVDRQNVGRLPRLHTDRFDAHWFHRRRAA